MSLMFADKIKGTDGQNPFSDSQARNFSDQKVLAEFFPLSLFWTLFNDQHEVLLGTRGSGKTFLLKMMRYSMLKRINDEKAKALVSEKKYIALYVPMHLEFVLPFNNKNLNEDSMIRLFQVAFNCFLSESLLSEVKSIVEDIDDDLERLTTQITIIQSIEEIWFGETTGSTDFETITNKVRKIYFGIDWDNPKLDSVPAVFKRQICSPLVACQKVIINTLKLSEEPTWIVCVDEAEFLNETLQKCINGIFRSDSNKIALKIATLPFSHSTLDTMEKGIVVSDGNDFKYTIVDMSSDDPDFIGLTNNLCCHRLKERFSSEEICHSLEDFVGMVGKDDYIDYYRLEVGEERASQEYIKERIVDSFGNKRKKNSLNYTNERKTIFDKFAPIFYLREMKKLSNTGNHKPGWYAGSKMIRKVSQGNPRLFIQVMSDLFEKAKCTTLTPKAQHEVIFAYAQRMCLSTKALEINGPKAHKNLDKIATVLSDKIHGEHLVTGGNTFTIKYTQPDALKNEFPWLKLAIANSRIVVDEKTLRNGINEDTKFMLGNAYAITYWIPMRSDTPVSIILDEKTTNEYVVRSKKTTLNADDEYHQLSIFEE